MPGYLSSKGCLLLQNPLFMFPQTAFHCRAVVGGRTDFGRYPLDLCDSVKASVRFQVNFGEGFLQRRTIFSPVTCTENASLLGHCLNDL